jgi:hypothetical protein
MPRDLARLVKDARHGRMRVDLDLKRLDSCGHRLHSAMNRATIGIMTASLVVGSSIVMTVAEGPTLLGVPLLTFFGLLGYLIAFVNSLWIIFSIWRCSRQSGKRSGVWQESGISSGPSLDHNRHEERLEAHHLRSSSEPGRRHPPCMI